MPCMKCAPACAIAPSQVSGGAEVPRQLGWPPPDRARTVGGASTRGIEATFGALMTFSDITTDVRGDRLREALGVRVIFPGDDGYDAARLPWNVAVDQRPFA